ncbi:ElyC/SanA/YdcF family protein [Thioalkalivibrio nitratireducens]|uniref:ElyC/SanA/YdcF family protein n=1 Tax=Thioalkalivibrio nitratireducens TaxID=186931 RepID=UPI003AAF120F
MPPGRHPVSLKSIPCDPGPTRRQGPGKRLARFRRRDADRSLEALPEARLRVSGASRDAGRLPVALGYAQAAQALGVDPARIVVLDTPVDTAQEAYAVQAVLLDGERFFRVTSASHLRRAVRHFERAGLEPIPAPTGFKTGPDPAAIRRRTVDLFDTMHPHSCQGTGDCRRPSKTWRLDHETVLCSRRTLPADRVLRGLHSRIPWCAQSGGNVGRVTKQP